MANWIKCTYKELRSALGLLQKICWCNKSSQKQHLFQVLRFPFNVYKTVVKTYLKEQGLLMDQDIGKLYNFFYNSGFLSIRSF